MMKGFIQGATTTKISERKLRAILPAISPYGHYTRQTNSHEIRNPTSYYARYFGHKVHLDQNEKLVNYGVTYVLARDGFSGKIVAGAVMPVKNNITIYDQVYRKAVFEHGLWDQIRVDHGREFYLTLYMQENLRIGRGDENIAPYTQTTSTYNHIIERVWVELNKRVTYPVKRVIVSMDNDRIVNMDQQATKFCVSTVLCRVCEVGMERMITAWNSHPIPRHGVPNELQTAGFHTSNIRSSEIPTAASAAELYRRQGGRLANPQVYGADPLQPAFHQRREERWFRQCGMDVEDIFSNLITGNPQPLETAITDYIELTSDLMP